MALINCPECRANISERASACPHCGFPIQSAMPPTIPATPKAAKKKSSTTSGCLLLFLLVGGCTIFMTPQTAPVSPSDQRAPTSYPNRPSPSTTSTTQRPSVGWYSGGTLHQATLAEWNRATPANRLATAGDWLAASLWKDDLRSPADFELLKIKAEMLMKAVDEVAKEPGSGGLQVSEMAAAVLVLANDLGPD